MTKLDDGAQGGREPRRGDAMLGFHDSFWSGVGRTLCELALRIAHRNADGEIASKKHYQYKLFKGPLPDDFRAHVGTGYMEASDYDPDIPTVLMFGGLALTGQIWRMGAHRIYSTIPVNIELHSLEGDLGTWENLLRASHNTWVERIIRRARSAQTEHGVKPIVFACSTSSLAAIVAASKAPELFSGLVLLNTPFELSNRSFQQVLFAAGEFSKRNPRVHGPARDIPIPLKLRRLFVAEETGGIPHAVLPVLPFSKFMELRRLQIRTADAIPKLPNHLAVDVIHSISDDYCNIDVARRYFERIPCKDKSFHAIPGGHLPMVATEHAIRDGFHDLVISTFSSHLHRSS